MSIAAVRSALATAVDTIEGVRAVAYLSDQVTGDAMAVVVRKGIDYDVTFGDEGGTLQFGVQVFRNRTAEKQAQLFLDTLCEASGATSVKKVIEGDAGVADATGRGYAQVKAVSEDLSVEVGGIAYVFIEFEVEVIL